MISVSTEGGRFSRQVAGICALVLCAMACHESTVSDEEARLGLPLSDRIVFDSNRADSLGDVLAMKLDGSDAIALTNQTTADGCPALSPDGQWIAFYEKPVTVSNTRYELRSYSLELMKANGAQKRALSDMSLNGWGGCPFWSPNSDLIGVLDILQPHNVHTPTNYRFRVLKLDGTVVGSFSKSEEVAGLKFAPDGSRLLTTLWDFSFGPYNTRASFLTFGGVESRLVSDGFTPDWSMSAGKIAYGCSGICLMNPDGTGQTKIISENLTSLPLFSPDGSLIAYSCYSSGAFQFCFTTVDGKGTGPFPGAPYGSARAWAPDSRSLAFNCGSPPEDICVIDRDGGNFRNLTQSPTFYDRNASFSPMTSH